MKTRIGETLNKTKLLFDSIAWLEAFTPDLRLKMVKEWLQKDQLTGKGVDSNGEIIGFYSLATEFISEGRKQEGDHFTLDDSGAFYASTFVRVLIDSVIFEADSGKMEDQEWWQNEILNLTDENLQKLIEEVKVKYIDYARRTLEIK